MYINIVLFFLVAIIYSTAGFGGGSLYLAILSASDLNPETMVAVALSCNLIVSSIGTYNFFIAKEFLFSRVAPLILLSLPFSFWASTWNISNDVFFLTLASGLFISGVLIFIRSQNIIFFKIRNQNVVLLFIPIIGIIAGITGIGGGVYLAPLLYLVEWGKPKEIAGASAFFIFMNSCSGLLARWNADEMSEMYSTYWTLPLAVILGGWIGSKLSTKFLEQNSVRVLTAGILLFAACRIFVRVL